MKKLFILLSVLLFAVVPTKIFALTGNLSLNCDNAKLSPGAKTTCRVSVTCDEFVIAVHSKIVLGNGLSLVSSTKENSWEGSSEDGVIDVYTDEDHGRNFVITTFEVQASSDITNGLDTSINLSESEMASINTNFIGQPVSSQPLSLRITSTVNNLKSLSVSGGKLDFRPDTTSYNLTIDADKVTISAALEDETAKLDGTGEKTLKEGLNTFKVTVTSESGAAKTYTLNITRPKKTTDSGSSGTSGNTGSSTTKPSSGSSENKKSSDNKLSSLKVNDKEIKLSDSETSYKLTLDYESEEVEITYKTKDSKAKVKVEGDKKLKVGENTFKIVVTAEDGTVKTYTLTVTRAPEGQKVSSNNYLKDLTIENYSLSFNKQTEKYKIEIKNEDKLNIKATPEDTKASVRILGNADLENGSNIKIVVTAEDGSTREYNINIVKKSNPFLIVILGCLAILIVTIVVIVVKKRKNK